MQLACTGLVCTDSAVPTWLLSAIWFLMQPNLCPSPPLVFFCAGFALLLSLGFSMELHCLLNVFPQKRHVLGVHLRRVVTVLSRFAPVRSSASHVPEFLFESPPSFFSAQVLRYCSNWVFPMEMHSFFKGLRKKRHVVLLLNILDESSPQLSVRSDAFCIVCSKRSKCSAGITPGLPGCLIG